MEILREMKQSEAKKVDYYVIGIKPFTKKVFVEKADDYEKAKEIAEIHRRKKKNDVVIVESDGKNFEIQNFGYFKVYRFLNNLLLIFSCMLIIIFSYLYYKFLNLKK